MTSVGFKVVSFKDRPDLLEAADAITPTVWPEFMLNDPVANRYWFRLYEVFPEYQFTLLEKGTDDIIAVGNSLPLVWEKDWHDLPDDGWDWALAQGFKDREAGRSPTTQCALSITIARPYQGKGISAHVVSMMRSIGEAHGLNALIAPVRPSQKTHYPLIPIDRYVHWRNSDGLPFDAWLRVHARLGAEIIKVCPQAMTIPGTVEQWEAWAKMRFPESGVYTVPGALVPVTIDCEANQGTYIEPNVWMCHPIRHQ